MPQQSIVKPFIHPYLALALGAIFVSSAAVLVKLSTSPAAVVAFYRLFFTVLLMLPFSIYFLVKEIPLIQRKEWILAGVSGAFLALHFILWFESLNYTSVASSVVLVTLQPLFTFVGAYFWFKERINLQAILGAVLAIVGSTIICWGDIQIGGMAFLGNLLALAGAMAVSIYWLAGQRVRKKVSLISYTFVVYSASAMFLLAYVLVTRADLVPTEGFNWLIFIALAIFPTLLGHSIFNWTLRWVTASIVSVTILFEPIGASALAYFILEETIQPTQWFGGLLILLGIFFFIRQKDR